LNNKTQFTVDGSKAFFVEIILSSMKLFCFATNGTISLSERIFHLIGQEQEIQEK